MQRISLASCLALSTLVVLAVALPWDKVSALSGGFLRHKRAADDDAVCKCYIPGDIVRIIKKTTYFDFSELSQLLEAHCPMDAAMLTDCKESTCPSAAHKNFVVHRLTGFQSECTNKSKFSTFQACWAGDFKSEMIGCLDNFFHLGESAMRTCVVAKVKTLNSCTAEAQAFFLQIFDLKLVLF